MIAGLVSDRGCGAVPPDGTPSHPFSLVLLETDHQCYAVLCNASAAPRRSRSKPQSVARQSPQQTATGVGVAERPQRAAAVRARGDGPRGRVSGELSGLGVQLAQILGEIVGPRLRGAPVDVSAKPLGVGGQQRSAAGDGYCGWTTTMRYEHWRMPVGRRCATDRKSVV